jgi:hypothetical protein
MMKLLAETEAMAVAAGKMPTPPFSFDSSSAEIRPWKN